MTPTLTSLTLALAATTTMAMAGTDAKKTIQENQHDSVDWCSWLQEKPGTLYKNKKNPYIQELRVFGRFHWQYAYVDGRGADDDRTRKFNYDTEEIRRFRLGGKLKFLNFFEANASVNLNKDLSPLGGSREIDYTNLYSATLEMDLRKAFDLNAVDGLTFRIGKEKVSNGAESAISSRFIQTVERSSLANYIATPSTTGLVGTVNMGRWNGELAMFSGDLEKEFSDFDNGFFYTFLTGYEFKKNNIADKSHIDLRIIINGDEEKNAIKNPNSIGSLNQKWVASLSTTSEKGRFHLLTDLVYGDNGTDHDYSKKGNLKSNPDREGSFWGIVILPSYWLVEERLEGVFRYQYAGASEKEGFRISSRYSRIAGKVGDFSGPNDLSNGRGDSHHSAYLGLNYFLCGENAKIMTGIEYDDLDSGSQDVYEGTTIWAAFRMFF